MCLVLALAPMVVHGRVASTPDDVPGTPRYELVAVYPHDRHAWTQGLAFRKGVLYESTGLYGSSSLRRVELQTGKVLKRRDLADHLFAEGLTFVADRAFQLTWKEHRAFVYDPVTFERRRVETYAGEGWGLTDDGRRLVMSDGSSRITFRDPADFRVLRRITVTSAAGDPVERLNELEWIDGVIWANVWQTKRIIAIDPATGDVIDRIDLSALVAREEAAGDPDVLNGIAWLASERRMFVTGKRWKHLYEIRILPPS
jgi:glutamine cyclotransferase